MEREIAFGAARQLLEPVLRVSPPAQAVQLLSGAASPAQRLLGASAAESLATATPPSPC